ncbi:MAG: gliding motility-associated C-terminal domain-containing protein [Saprospiraceae bacterium]|nr:gliding motility-associated C-terminal domain-containing protein [Saprospiraceae bacterium]
MNNLKIRFQYIIVLIFIGFVGGVAQPEYTMSNNLVRDCEGILLDSEEGPEDGQYDHNEDYTFTICVDQANEIILAFDFFASEDRYDVLTIYDGPDTNSPVLATLSGIVQPPPVLIATSGCVTLHFVSDDNIVASGWRMRWTVEIEEPEIPDLLVDGNVECPFQNGPFRFTVPIDCDLFQAGNFSIVGPGNPTISGINLLDCDSSTYLGSTFEIIFDDSLRAPGTYRLEFMGSIQDVCGEWHDILANVIFTLSDCPIQVLAYTSERACVGECGRVYAEVVGDQPDNYIFNWSHTADNSQEVDICFDDTTTVTVNVININTNRSTEAWVTYVPFPLPEFLNPLQSDTFCAGNRDHFYEVTIPGGNYYSDVIPNWLRDAGRYQFWRWGNAPGLSRDIIEYHDPNGCVVRDTVYVYPINAGSIQAACAGSPAFNLNGGTPNGGYWEGPHVSPDGVFDPTTSGSFIVTYVAPNGCRRAKRVNVGDSIQMPDIDTLCSSQQIDLRDFTDPYGGRWSGPGIRNNVLGRLQAWRPDPNQTYRYYYDVNGCIDSIDIYIQELYAGPDRSVCVEADTFFLNISGNWSGPGTYLPLMNAFDISGLGTGEYNYTLEQDGCTDVFKLYIIEPYVEVHGTLEFCQENTWYNIQDFVDIFPDWGNFTTSSLKDSNDTWYFNPRLLGPGLHPIVFEAVSCGDTIWIDVEGDAQIPDYAFCEFDDPTFLEAQPDSGVWGGNGILDNNTGLFDPQVTGIGFHEITYTSPRGCLTRDTIEVFQFEEVSINGIEQQYCFSDTSIVIDLQPAGGELYINGMLSSNTFNPSQLGTGVHEVYYTRGSGECQSDDRLFFSVLPPIDGVISASKDSICLGDPTVVEIKTEGGLGNLSSVWDGDLGFGSSHIIRPDQSGWYYVTVEDGCSLAYRDSIFIYVYPEFTVDYETGPEVCYGDTTWLRVIPPNETDYRLSTDDEDIFLNGFMVQGISGFYNFKIEELFSGCTEEVTLELEGADPLRANFSINPNQPCIDIVDNEIEIIDLAVGYTDGWMSFGDGSDTVSLLSGPLGHAFNEIGDFKITQYVENELGCTDSLSQWICVNNKVQYYIPNVFTPNGDGENDEFQIYVHGVKDLEWKIYSRFGGTVFYSTSPDDAWDGTYDGKKLDPAVFVLKVSFKDAQTDFPYLITKTLTMVR